MNQEFLQRLTKSKDGQELRDFIVQNINSLNTTDDIEYKRDRDIAIEVIARQRAIKKLTNMFNGLFVQERREAEEPEHY